MQLNVYKHDESGRVSQTEIEKTVTASPYDLFFGTVEDILQLLDAVGDDADADAIIRVVRDNWGKLKVLLLDVFPELNADDLRYVKLRELVPVIIELFKYVAESVKGNGSKNI